MTAQTTASMILRVASHLFIQQGYTATSIREIAAGAGIGKATIYYHFPDKDAIAEALIKQTFSDMKNALTLLEAERDPRQRIINSVTESVEYLLESADIISVLRREVSGSREMMQHEFRTFFQSYIALLADAVRRGIDEGIFRPVDPEQTARVLMIMLQGSFAMVYMSGLRNLPHHETAAAILDVFFQGIDTR